jgi:hypothetical protein
MHRLTMDGQIVTVPAGATLLDAARQLGIHIPTLCHREGLPAGTSCMVCVVEVEGLRRLVPSCAYPARADLVVRTSTPAVLAARRTAVELLLSEHVGDCEGPCQRGCPANMDIPRMIRQIAAGRMEEALETVRQDIALPSVLGRICPAPCEKVCRRGKVDRPVSICLLKRLAGDCGVEEAGRRVAPETGRRVAIVGAGPAGLAAAFYLRRQGHACALYDEQSAPGGSLRVSLPAGRLPPDVLAREVESILRCGVEFHAGVNVGRDITLADLRTAYDAVILAVGLADAGRATALGVPFSQRGIQADSHTYVTPLPGVFAIGSAIRPFRMAVSANADGRKVAAACGQFLAGKTVTAEARPFQCVIGNLTPDELQQAVKQVSRQYRLEPAGGMPAGFSLGEAVAEAARCLHCDCRRADDCRLRETASLLGADRRALGDSGRHAVEQLNHPGGLVFEPGKCIKCGLCVRLTAQHADIPGLTFIRRGFDTRVSPPVGETFETALAGIVAEVAALCPTGALVCDPVCNKNPMNAGESCP